MRFSLKIVAVLLRSTLNIYMSIPRLSKKPDNNSNQNFLFRCESLGKDVPCIAPSAESPNSSFEHIANAAKKTNSRHCDEMKIYFLDHYLDFLTYLAERKKRTETIQMEMSNVRYRVLHLKCSWTMKLKNRCYGSSIAAEKEQA